MNVVVDTIVRRQNCKSFQDRIPESDQLNAILSCGRSATDGLNIQSTHFYVITSSSILRKLNDVVQQEIMENEDQLYRQSFISGVTHDQHSFFYNAPVLIVLTDYGQNPHAVNDCISAAQNMAIAASSLGLGSSQIHHLSALNHSLQVRSLLNLSQEETIHAALAIGYIKSEGSFMMPKKVFGNPIIRLDGEA